MHKEPIKVQGIVVHKISPFEQRAFPNFFKTAIPNTFRRIRSNVFRILPAFVVGTMVYYSVEELYEQYQRKDPKLYENDV